MKTKIYLLGVATMLSLATCEKKEPEQQAQEYTVTFRYETSSTAYKVVQTVEEGALLTPPRDTAYRVVVQLQGWSSSSFTVQPWNFATDVVNKDMVLYAYYRHPIIFDYRGKAISDTTWFNDFIPARPQPVALPDTTPEVNSFIFDGWYRDSNYTTAWDSNYHVNPNTRIYAKWAPAYTVTYNTQGGIAVVPSKVRENALLLRPEKPTHATNENLLFWGWYKEPACTNLWDFYSDTVKENTTLYARWYSIETSGMDFPIHIISCERKQFKALKDDLLGRYTWTKNGGNSDVHYNPCPEGWEVPTVSELRCVMEQMHPSFVHNQTYWSREGTQDRWGICFGKYVVAFNSGVISTGGTEFVNGRSYIRCVRYD